jgi:hypothetical protein
MLVMRVWLQAAETAELWCETTHVLPCWLASGLLASVG